MNRVLCFTLGLAAATLGTTLLFAQPAGPRPDTAPRSDDQPGPDDQTGDWTERYHRHVPPPRREGPSRSGADCSPTTRSGASAQTNRH